MGVLFFILSGLLWAEMVISVDLDIIENVHNVRKLASTISNYPKEYQQMVGMVAKLTNMNVFHGIHLGHHTNTSHSGQDPGYSATVDNSTITMPITTTESSTTKRPPKPPKFRVSELCTNHTEAVNLALTLQEPWAIKMLDAAGKLPANFLGGAIVWFGDFEECIGIKNVVANFSGRAYRFDSQYCKVRIPMKGELANLLPGVTITTGVCVPNSCSPSDVRNIIRAALYNISRDLTASTQLCIETEIPYDTRAIIVLVVIGFFIALMTLGTAFDVIAIQLPKWRREDKESFLKSDMGVEASEKSALLSGEQKPSTFSEYNPGTAWKLLLSFSVYTNGAKILSTQQSKDTITCLNGIRFLSMTWVIMGHSFSAPLNIADNATDLFPKMLNRWTFLAVCNAFVSVDSFFTLSGCLLTYLVMKELKKNNGKLKWGMFYFHRFWRLTPPYMLVLMVYVSLFHYTGSGPNWPTDGPEKNHCEKAWYFNLFYINNFAEERENKCMGWAWYLANDMQFYVISPIILLPLYHFHMIGEAVLMFFLTGTLITTGVISNHYDIPASNFDGGSSKHWQKIYIKPYCRMGPYLIGMYCGYLLYKTDCKYRFKKVTNLLGWAVATGAGMAVVYGLYDDINTERLSTEVAAFYNAVHRSVWGACLSWVIFTCATGNGGFVNTLLSWKGFVPLSKLTYMAYLLHMLIINHWKYSQKRMIHLSDSEFIYEFLGHTVLSYMAAFVTSLAFESPMMGLESVIFKREQKKR